MGQLVNCRRCGRLFASAGAALCPECIEARERDFERVREWLDRHPRGTASQAAEATGVPLAEVTGFIREGRLRLAGGELRCERCGTAIPNGRLCASCAEELERAVTGSARGPASQGQASTGARRAERLRFHTRRSPDG
ncbi:MAG: MerR family transcriptional regulator [Bacillota bacterium]|nr:MerR family transcriptional regulator [Bacillota bacterium]